MVLFKIWINVYVGDVKILVIINCISKKVSIVFYIWWVCNVSLLWFILMINNFRVIICCFDIVSICFIFIVMFYFNFLVWL